jgi:hypothetical protein
MFEALIALSGAPDVGFGVEVNVAEHALQFGAVDVVNFPQRNVDEVTQVGRVARTGRRNCTSRAKQPFLIQMGVTKVG